MKILIFILVIVGTFLFLASLFLVWIYRKKKHSSSKHASKKDDHAHGDSKSPHGSHDESHGGHDEHDDHGHHKIGFFRQIWEIILLGVIIIILLSVLFFIIYGVWTFFTKDYPKEKQRREITQRQPTLPSSFTKVYNLTIENPVDTVYIPPGYISDWKNSGKCLFQQNENQPFIDQKGVSVKLKEKSRYNVISRMDKDVVLTFTFKKK